MKKSSRKPKSVQKEEVANSEQNGNEEKAEPETKDTKPDSEDEYEVEQIVDMEVKLSRKCPIKFRVRWVGFTETDDTWEYRTDLSCQELIDDFLEVSGRKPEYENALTAKQEATKGIRDARRRGEHTNYSELNEDQDEILPSGTRTRKIKRKWDPYSAEGSSPKKTKAAVKKTPNEEYEVQEIVDKRSVSGKVEFKVRWRGFARKFDSWVEKKDLNCKQLIDQYDEKDKEDDAEWKVDGVVKMRSRGGKKEYFVKWKGYSSKSNTWEPEENVLGCDQLTKFLNNNKKSTEKSDTAKKPAARGRRKAKRHY